ncbi:MAG: glycosyltransferase family 4 protein [Vulcanisaeta sp.]
MRILTNTTKIGKLLSNYAEVEVLKVRTLRDLISKVYINSYDLIYFAKYTPPLLDLGSINQFRTKGKLMIGMHVPVKIDHINRPHHIVYNLLMPMQTTYYLRMLGAYLHVLNKDDEEYLRNRVHSRFNSRVIYAPLFTDTSIFKPGNKYGTFTLLYSARASWQKGTDIAVKIIERLIMELKDNIEIKIVAYGPLTHLYNKLRKFRNIEILNYLPLDEFSSVLSKSHVLLFTSRYESFAQLPLDSLASGTPVVSFNVRGFVKDYVIKDEVLGKYIVDFDDVDNIIDRVIELARYWYNNENHYYELVKYSRQFAERFSIENISKIYLDIFTNIINNAT